MRRQGNRRTATIKDVAAHAGVSIGSVSRVMNGAENLTQETIDRVRAAVERLGYRPNPIARSMRQSKTHAVGCLISNVEQTTAAEMVSAAEQSLTNLGYMTVIADSRYDQPREARAIELFQDRRMDGMILAVTDDQDETIISALEARKTPVVLWERDAYGRFDAVLSDHRRGMFDAASYLYDLDHERVALVAGHATTWVGRETVSGLEEAAAKHSRRLDPALIYRTSSFGRSAAEQLLRGPARPTGVVANVNDLSTIIRVALQMGLRIPEDLSVIAIGDTEIISVLEPKITAIRGDGRLVGQTAAEMLVARFKSPRGKRARTMVDMHLEIRGSCARRR